MSRAFLIIASAADRKRAHAWIDQAPWNTRVEVKAPKRTLAARAKADHERYIAAMIQPNGWQLGSS